MAANVKEIFAEHKWLRLVAALLIFASGALCAVWIGARDAEVAVVPAMEAMKTEEASRKISETIVEAQKQRDRLPESVGADGDADIARRWNGLLRRYRSSRTQTDGVQFD